MLITFELSLHFYNQDANVVLEWKKAGIELVWNLDNQLRVAMVTSYRVCGMCSPDSDSTATRYTTSNNW